MKSMTIRLVVGPSRTWQ